MTKSSFTKIVSSKLKHEFSHATVKLYTVDEVTCTLYVWYSPIQTMADYISSRWPGSEVTIVDDYIKATVKKVN